MVDIKDAKIRAQAKELLQQKDTIFGNIHNALSSNNRKALGKNVNILKNAGELFGSERMALIARHIITLCEDKSFTGIDEAMIELVSATNALCNELEENLADSE